MYKILIVEDEELESYTYLTSRYFSTDISGRKLV